MVTPSKKATAKKAVSKKVSRKKTTTRKAVSKKATVKKPVSRKPVGKKSVTKKTAATKPSLDHVEISNISEKNLHTVAADIDRQMKMLAEIDTRVLIAKDQLADFQEKVQAKISAYQKKKAEKQTEHHKDIMTSIRETKDEAAKIIKDSKALNETYDVVVKQLEKGRVAATKEMKKAEAVFMKKLHEVEAKVMKKAGEIKKNLNK